MQEGCCDVPNKGKGHSRTAPYCWQWGPRSSTWQGCGELYTGPAVPPLSHPFRCWTKVWRPLTTAQGPVLSFRGVWLHGMIVSWVCRPEVTVLTGVGHSGL